MNKSVLVIDTPTGCLECGLNKNNMTCDRGKDDDCPLRPLPDKEVCNEYDFEHYKNGVSIGWNRCLEKITSEGQ